MARFRRTDDLEHSGGPLEVVRVRIRLPSGQSGDPLGLQEKQLALAQGLLDLFALGNVAPDAVIDRPRQNLHDLCRYMDIPEFSLPGALSRFEVGLATADHLIDARPTLSSGFINFHIHDGELGKLLAGIAQLLVSRRVKLEESGCLRVKDHAAVG